MDWIRWAALAGVQARAVYTDVKRGTIENMLIVTGLVIGLICAGIRGGPMGCLQSVKMAGIVLAMLFLLFVMRGLGAGDIKLLCVVAAFFPDRAMTILVTSFLAGGLLAIGKIAFRRIKKEKISLRKETIHFSVPIALGTWITLIWI